MYGGAWALQLLMCHVFVAGTTRTTALWGKHRRREQRWRQPRRQPRSPQRKSRKKWNYGRRRSIQRQNLQPAQQHARLSCDSLHHVYFIWFTTVSVVGGLTTNRVSLASSNGWTLHATVPQPRHMCMSARGTVRELYRRRFYAWLSSFRATSREHAECTLTKWWTLGKCFTTASLFPWNEHTIILPQLRPLRGSYSVYTARLLH